MKMNLRRELWPAIATATNNHNDFYGNNSPIMGIITLIVRSIKETNKYRLSDSELYNKLFRINQSTKEYENCLSFLESNKNVYQCLEPIIKVLTAYEVETKHKGVALVLQNYDSRCHLPSFGAPHPAANKHPSSDTYCFG